MDMTKEQRDKLRTLALADAQESPRSYVTAQDVIALLDRIDELEGDAERYRWIRANCLSVTDLAATRIGASDEAIDKARGQ